MRTYKEYYEKAKKDKAIKPITATYRRFERVGDEIIGQYVSRAPVTSSLGGGEYHQYLFKTDKGLVKFALGSSNDNEIGAVMVPGQVYRIAYAGKEDLSSGRRVNKFIAEHIPVDADESLDGGPGGDTDIKEA